MTTTSTPMMILIAGPYRSGTGDDPEKMAANLQRLEEASWPLFQAGHVPMIGEWVALPIWHVAGGREVGDALYDQSFIGTECWSALYRERAGIEGTLSQGIRSSGLRQTRYRGLAKTSLQNTAIGAAINVARVVNWLDANPRAATRQARFTRLAA